MLSANLLDQNALDLVLDDAKAEVDAAVAQTMQERTQDVGHVEKFTYAPSEVDVVYPDDYTGLPK